LARDTIKDKGFSIVNLANFGVLRHRQIESRAYALFYMADNTPMLHEKVSQDPNVILLQIRLDAANCKGVYFTDGNLAVHSTSVFSDPEDLVKLNWSIILSRNPAYSDEWKRMRMAEVLILSVCPPEFIQNIHVNNDYVVGKQMFDKVRAIVQSRPNGKIKVLKDLSPSGVL
jgi:hypothetical protein